MAKLEDIDKNKRWLTYLQTWVDEAPNQEVTDDDIGDLVLVANFLDIDGAFWQQLVISEFNEKRCRSNFDRMKKEGIIPAELTFEDYMALVLSPPEVKPEEGIEKQFPPGHPFWKAHGVNDVSEWEDLHINGFTLKKIWPRAARALINAYRNAFERQGFSDDKLVYSEDIEAISAQTIQEEITGQRLPGQPHPGKRCLEGIPNYNTEFEPANAMELLLKVGLSEQNVSSKAWPILMRLSQNILDGKLEPGSKKGVSLTAVFGAEAPKVRKIISRIRERLRK